jgi:hypothetical protein
MQPVVTFKVLFQRLHGWTEENHYGLLFWLHHVHNMYLLKFLMVFLIPIASLVFRIQYLHLIEHRSKWLYTTASLLTHVWDLLYSNPVGNRLF